MCRKGLGTRLVLPMHFPVIDQLEAGKVCCSYLQTHKGLGTQQHELNTGLRMDLTLIDLSVPRTKRVKYGFVQVTLQDTDLVLFLPSCWQW